VIEMRAGAIIDHYRVRGKLGEGGMGSVYKVQDMDSGEILAMKLVRPEAADRFMAEARALAALRHPHVIRFHSIWPMPDGTFGLLMDFVVGRDLTSLLRRDVEPRQVVELLHQVAMGLDYCHSKDVVHRDLKPQNIMVSQASDGALVAQIVDFGLGKDRGAGIDVTEHRAAGTIPFMPPEQFVDFRNAGPAADQWSLAASAWLMLVGRLPYPNAPFDFGSRARIDEVSALPPQMESVFERAFRLHPQDRYLSCVDLTRDLGATLGMILPAHAKDRVRTKVTERVVPVVPDVDWSLREQDDLWGFCAGRMGNTIRQVAASRREVRLPLGTVSAVVRVRRDSLLVELPGKHRSLPKDFTADPRGPAMEAIGWRRPARIGRTWTLQVPVEHNPDDVAKRILEALEIGYGLDANAVYKDL
jgi:serine/threonine protein kinase